MHYWINFHYWLNKSYDDPKQALPHLLQARATAQERNETRHLFIMNHWLLQVYLYALGDYTTGLDLAIQTALDAQNPAVRDLHEWQGVQCYLITAYLGVDPFGYAGLIHKALDSVRNDLTPFYKLFFHQLDCAFALVHRRLDEARRIANQYLQDAENGHFPDYYRGSCIESVKSDKLSNKIG